MDWQGDWLELFGLTFSVLCLLLLVGFCCCAAYHSLLPQEGFACQVKEEVPTFSLDFRTTGLWLGLVTLLGSKADRPLILFGFVSGVQSGGAFAMVPANLAEAKRAALRASLQLPADRVVRQETRKRRQHLLMVFSTWLWTNRQVSLRGILNQKPVDAELLSHWLLKQVF